MAESRQIIHVDMDFCHFDVSCNEDSPDGFEEYSFFGSIGKDPDRGGDVTRDERDYDGFKLSIFEIP